MTLLWLGLKPKTRADQEKLGRGLQLLIADEASLAVRTRAPDGVTMLGAESEEQLEAAIDRLAREYKVEAFVTGVDVAYKEALTREAVGEGKYAKQTGGRGQYAHVRIVARPGEPGSGFVFDNAVVGGAIPGEFVKPIAEGLREAASGGVLAGYPIDDVHVTLYDGSFHEMDSSAMAFKIAAALAFMDAAKKAQPVLLEPFVHVSVFVPPDYLPQAREILVSRRYRQLSTPTWSHLWARMPMSETFGLASQLRVRTGGYARCGIAFAGYAPAAHAGDDGDRDTPVREPKHPRTPLRPMYAAVPEPIDDVWTAWDDDETIRPHRA
jgi:elongation factor G